MQDTGLLMRGEPAGERDRKLMAKLREQKTSREWQVGSDCRAREENGRSGNGHVFLELGPLFPIAKTASILPHPLRSLAPRRLSQ
ncbi:hypothetical protein HBI56_062170 [Parastagonospora nodorum]|nr:hypothetical protein HBH56_156380 [Parastagonospora nodorum]KAH3922924.1 hypothetical protein HBH54_218340 [Parastagonospora nodorum]KAH3946899.1 hypothetical protein HBH53_125490 [Parastagonospora nodorum]KAH3969657.1 hypothetical protein HBH52_173490 [Parastagonospora nodorum]KAH3973550.1 hypothetical protein HBH51_098710 [Parastagonospora nodorum]